MENKNVSKLTDHTIQKGLVVTPFNKAFGKQLYLSSWYIKRLPEYIWLALIHFYYGRNEGLNRAGFILKEITELGNTFSKPRLSSIFKLPKSAKKEIFESICKHIDSNILAPLTVIYRQNKYPLFNEYFYNPSFSVNNRVIKIKQIIDHYYFHQSNQATDIRFLVLALQLFSGKLYIKQGLDRTIEALKKYPYTSHEDEKMKFYRPAVRSLEGMVINEDTKNQDFLNDFWKELGMMSTCNLKHIKYDDDEDKPTEFIKDTREALEYIIIDNKEKLLSDDSKFEVIIGSITYIFKIFKEVIENDLSNKILGRHAIRTLIEVYIMIKYLLKKEKDKSNIWQEYKYYGISKYKLILLKAREDMSSKAQKNHHLATSLLDAIVNEKKWEEFVDIDLRYFDQESIRNKSIYVEEKELYDLFYNYDTNYVHGFWGAIRESSMLFCDNSAHKYHNVPDFISEQNLPSVKESCIMIVKKIIKLSCDLYEYPEWYINEYIRRDDSNEKKDD